jgi:hypothetical protein
MELIARVARISDFFEAAKVRVDALLIQYSFIALQPESK